MTQDHSIIRHHRHELEFAAGVLEDSIRYLESEAAENGMINPDNRHAWERFREAVLELDTKTRRAQAYLDFRLGYSALEAA